MSLLADVVGQLGRSNTACAMVGATAMTAHGVARSTMDIDLLIVGASAMENACWEELRSRGATVDVRRGLDDDPLAGVIRVSRQAEAPVDVIVGRYGWQKRAIDRAVPVEFDSVVVPVVTLVDLVLLKLFAGGPQDLWDVRRLLAASPDDTIVARVDATLIDLPLECRQAWRAAQNATR